MGCCQSSEDDEAGPQARPPAHDSSQAAINQPRRSLSHIESSRTSSVVPPPPAPPPQQQQTNRPPNQRIRPPSPIATSPTHVVNKPPPWTRSQIEREREAFFDTRVAGRKEVWDGLKMVCELLRQDDIEEAQAVLDAINVTSPNGRVAVGRGRDRARGGVFDERGELYEIPAWVVADPKDLIEDAVEKDAVAGASNDGSDDEEDEEGQDDAEAQQRRRDEKGKGRQDDLADVVKIRCRLSDRGSDIVVQVGAKQRVAVIVRRIQEQIGTKRIRIVYLGHAMSEQKTLQEQGWKLGDVVNAMVFEGEESMLKGKKGSA